MHTAFSILAAIQVFFSPHGGCTGAIVKEIGQAKTGVLVQAYSFTSLPIAQALADARMRHLDVQVILDKGWQNESAKVEPLLAASNISVFIDAKHAIAHNKIVIVDNATVITGSFNFTNQAELMNAENLLIIHDPKLAARYTANWQAHVAHSLAP